MEQKSKKKYFIAALAVLLVAVAVGGTIAWLTAANSVTNSFTVGQITQPDPDVPDKPDPNLPNPDEEEDGNKATLKGNIYEIFSTDPKIIPGDSITKTPYIGIGKGSEDAFVFAYIDNKMMAQNAGDEDSTYFILNSNWAPVVADEYDGVSNAYTGGLFMYKGDTGTAAENCWGYLKGDAAKATWTPQIFDEVVTPSSTTVADINAELADDGTYETAPTMDVWCYIYATDPDANDKGYSAACSAAQAWAASDTTRVEIAGAVATTDEP